MALALIFCLCGILFLALGWRLWKKEQIGLLMEYHRRRVSDGDKKRFCALTGLGLDIIGGGFLLSGAWFAVEESLVGFLPFAAGFLAGFALILRAIRKYNR